MDLERVFLRKISRLVGVLLGQLILCQITFNKGIFSVFAVSKFDICCPKKSSDPSSNSYAQVLCLAVGSKHLKACFENMHSVYHICIPA